MKGRSYLLYTRLFAPRTLESCCECILIIFSILKLLWYNLRA